MSQAANVRNHHLEGGIQACRSCQELLRSAARDLKRDCADAGQSGWDDQRYHELVSIVEGCVNALHTPLDSLMNCETVLKKLLQAVAHYEQVQLSGRGGGSASGAAAGSDVDWSKGMNTSRERTILSEVYVEEVGSGEVSGGRVPPVPETKHLPSTEAGVFSGERGESHFTPANTEAQKKLGEYGLTGIHYKNGYPDFSPVATQRTPWGTVLTVVQIGHMTTARTNPKWEYGRRSDSHDPSADLGNYAQADNELCALLRKANVEVTPTEIEKYRKSNGLTWHECEDGCTMMLIPTVIHDACRHSGGVSEMNYRMALASVESDW